MERQTASANREFGRFSRGALVGTGALGGLGRAAAFASASFIGGAGLIVGLKSSSEAASNLAEQISKGSVVFGQSSQLVEEWSKTSVASMGIARDQAIETAAGFGALLKPLGILGPTAAKQSENLTQLGADLASFSNSSAPEALEAIRSGLIGEAEPLRRYGVLLSESRVQQEALRQTGKAHASELTNQEKVLARIAIIYRDTASAQGDFARTSGGLAGQQKTLAANLRNLQITLGTALNPEILKVTAGLNDWLGKTENQEQLQRDINEAVKQGAALVRGLGDSIQFAASVLGPATRAVGGLAHAVELLAIAMAVAKVSAWGRAVGLLAPSLTAATAATTVAAGEVAGAGAAADLAAGRVGVLRTALTRLGGLGAITVGIELVIHRKGVADFLDDHGLGFLRKPTELGLKDLIPGADKSVLDLLGIGGGTKRVDVNPATNPAASGPVRPTTPFVNPYAASAPVLPANALPQPFSKVATAAQQRAIDIAKAGTTSPTDDDVKAFNVELEAQKRRIAFAEKALAEHRGNQQAFADQLTDALNQQATIQGQLQGIADEKARLVQDGIDAAKQRAAEAAEQARQQAADAATARADALAAQEKEAADAKAFADRQAELRQQQQQTQMQILQNTLAATQLIANPAKQFEAQKAAQIAIVAALRVEAANINLNALEQAQARGDVIDAQVRLNDLIKGHQEQLAALRTKAAEDQKAAAEKAAAAAKEAQLAAVKAATKQIAETRHNDFTLQQLFEEAGKEQAMFGSNVGARGTAFSPQDARAVLAGKLQAGATAKSDLPPALRGVGAPVHESFFQSAEGMPGGVEPPAAGRKTAVSMTVVTQNFYGEKSAGQAIQDARAAAKNLR